MHLLIIINKKERSEKMFAKRLKQAMKEQKLTQTELAKRIGSSPSSISQYLSGNNQPTAKKLEKIAAALGVTEEWLTELEEDEVKTDESAKLTPEKAGKLMGVSAQYVRQGILQGILPFGCAIKIKGTQKYTYCLFPKKFTEFTGIEI